MNVCKECGKEFSYGKEARRKGFRKTICPSCSVSKIRHRNRDKALEYRGNKCIVCGYNKYSGALHLHHLDPSIKEFTINLKGCSRSWERIKIEADKCVVVCARCHAEVHANIIDINDYL